MGGRTLQESKLFAAKFISCFFVFLLGAWTTQVHAQFDEDTLYFLYMDSPPYMYSEGNKVLGTDAALIEAVAEDSDIGLVWVKTVSNRIQRFLSEGDKPYCTIGQEELVPHIKSASTFKTSISFGGLGKVGLLVRKKDKASIESFSSIKELVEASGLKGGFLRSAIQVYEQEMPITVDRSRHLIVEDKPFEMGQLIARSRIDFIFIAERGLETHQKFYDHIEPLDFAVIPDIPQKKRPLVFICAEAVSSNLVNKINMGITLYKGRNGH